MAKEKKEEVKIEKPKEEKSENVINKTGNVNFTEA
jgi:phage antirepressor YoqD-like protein